jgi:glycosyltransferase involved in cell wall biosynthesis
VTEVLPRVRAARPGASLDLVGPNVPGSLDDLAAVAGVRVHGWVDDLAAAYAAADLVVAPLLHGAGTRIKVLEAFAYRRPVVATAVAVAGLGVEHGLEVVIADTADDIAVAIVGVLDDEAQAQALVAGGVATLDRRFTPDVVAPLVRAVVGGRSVGRAPGD